jgi:putative ABC transport system permease protein/bacitracin transport system permease protein
MKFSVLNKVAFRSIVSHKRLYFPFLLAVSLLFSLEYILLSLMQNDYVNEFHPDLKMILGLGIFFSTLLIIIITLYTSNFIQNNQTKEFGLYTVLGLEKKHIRWVTFIQMVFNWLVTSVLSVVLGYLAGSLMFVGLNRLMQDTGAGLMDYPFQVQTAIGTIVLLLGTFLASFIIQAFKISRLNPIELLQSAHKGQKEPKGRWWLTLIGLATLVSGYYIALTTNDVLGSLQNIFIAIFFVIIGTYFLFISLSIFILKALQKNKNIYYKPNNFLSISGMLHRMNNNAVSLASIAILSSGVILVLGITTSLYRTMETQIEGAMPYDYEMSTVSAESFQAEPSENEAILSQTINEASNYGEITDVSIRSLLPTIGYLHDNEIGPLPAAGTTEYEALPDSGQPIYMLAETLDTYNDFTKDSKTLGENEVLMTSNLLDPEQFPTLEINENEYNTQVVSSDIIPSNYGVEVIYLVFSSQEELEQFRSKQLSYNPQDGTYNMFPYSTSATFNVESNEEKVAAYLSEAREERTLSISSEEEVRQSMYSLYGGLLFIGLIVSAVLIIGTILMLYFKQISEGYDDKKKFRIMKQVGLPDELIQKTIRSQIIWIFLLPIAVAIIHNIFASKIMYTLIGLFGSRDLTIFSTSYFGVLVVFAVVYLIFYWLTSRTYYNIINE